MAAQIQSKAILSEPALPQTAIRVLHIIENLNNQSVESWLLRVMRGAAAEYAHVHWAFFCVLGETGSLDDEARSLGADVIYAQYKLGDKLRFLSSLRNVMRQGHYDILHCHHDIMSAAYLLASAGLPFKKRIVHLHNTSLSLPTPSRIKNGLAREPLRQVCLKMADQIVGISREALESLVEQGQLDPKRDRVVHYAVDTARFASGQFDAVAFRHALGVRPAAKILLFVGRMVKYKNPSFVLEILEELIGRVGQAIALFVGTGPEEIDLLEKAKSKQLQNRIKLLGFRNDVPELMLASDVLVWPGLEKPKEGLGLGIVEAQAAGLPVIMSRTVPEEAIVVPELVSRLPLAAGPRAWADVVFEILKRPRGDFHESLARVESSSFSMNAGVKNLMALYEGTCSDHRSEDQGR